MFSVLEGWKAEYPKLVCVAGSKVAQSGRITLTSEMVDEPRVLKFSRVKEILN